MASGRVQLASVGIQDTFLTSDPQFTYFTKQYKRHTKFALEVIDNPVDGNLDFGSQVICYVPRKGDLIHTVYLHIELSQLSSVSSPTSNIGYTDSIGNAIIEYADLVIGGQTIQRITGEYMEMFSDICVGNSQQSALKYMVGRTGTINGLGPATTDNGYPKLFIIPLYFYFHGHESLSVPLSIIDKQDVQIRVKFRPLSQLIINTDSNLLNVPAPSDTVGTITKLSMPIEYVFLSDDEINYMKSKPIDYVVTQLQVSRFVMEPDVTSAQMLLQFVNPVKELFIVIQDRNTANVNDIFNFSNTVSGRDQLSSIELMFNGETRLSTEIANSLYLRIAQPMSYHTKTPDRYFYSYSFALKPEEPYPTGQVNMSRIISKLLTLNTTSSSQIRDVRIYAINYNILRINSGIAGILFIDNNFI